MGQIYCMVVTCLDVCIIYFISCDYNDFFIILYNILNIAELDCCQIIILSIYVPSTHAKAKKKWPFKVTSKRGSIHMKFSMTGQEKR